MRTPYEVAPAQEIVENVTTKSHGDVVVVRAILMFFIPQCVPKEILPYCQFIEIGFYCVITNFKESKS